MTEPPESLPMDPEKLRSELEEAGEVMVAVEEFETPLELHRHDTEIGDEVVTLELADGTLTFTVDSVVGYWRHYHSLGDYDLD